MKITFSFSKTDFLKVFWIFSKNICLFIFNGYVNMRFIITFAGKQRNPVAS